MSLTIDTTPGRLYVSDATPPVTHSEREADWQYLLSFAGRANSADAHLGDNDRIDADLARAYGKNEER